MTSARLRIGVIVMPTDFGADPRDVARALEDRGLESLFFPEHTHIPWSRESPFPIGGDLPQVYWRNLDPFATMAAAASVTEKLRFGTGICLLAQRDPIVTAKTLSTLDHLSGGRIELGVGAGWNVEEMRNHRVDPARRWSMVREHALAMKAIWAQEKASYDGEFVSFEQLASWPKPAEGFVPILIGGDSRYTASRIAGYGDGWIPVLDGDVADLIRRIREVERQLEAEGTFLPPVTVGFGYRHTAGVADVAALEHAAVDRILLSLDALPYDETVSYLDALATQFRSWLAA